MSTFKSVPEEEFRRMTTIERAEYLAAAMDDLLGKVAYVREQAETMKRAGAAPRGWIAFTPRHLFSHFRPGEPG